MRILLFLLLFVFLGILHSRADSAQDISAIKNSVVFVTASVVEPTGKVTTETGTGFICSASGYVITANHVVKQPNATISLIVGSDTGESLATNLVSAPDGIDAALLQLPASHGPYTPVTFGDPDAVDQGQPLASVGFPLGADYSATTGILGNKSGSYGYWQISMPLNYGNSGGPIMDDQGHVIGMVIGGISDAQAVSYMLPLNLLSPLITQCGDQWPPYGNPTQAAVTPQGQPLVTQRSPANVCHQITVVSAGLPPIYSKETICQ